MAVRALNTDPLRNFKFHVDIHHNLGGYGGMTHLGFMSASGLAATTEVISYREGGDNTALPLDAPVLTTDGWKPMGEIEVGDRVIDPRGEDSKVTDVIPAGVKSVYRVTLQDGSEAEACFGHLWEFQVRNTNNVKRTFVASTLDMKEYVEKKGYQVLLPKLEPFNYGVQPDLPLDPYLLGILLAEGSLSGDSVLFANEESEVVERVRAALPEGHRLEPKDVCAYRISVGNGGGAQASRNTHGRNLVLQAVRDLGLHGSHSETKFIPEQYLRASVEERLSLLRGIMDGDGWCDAEDSSSYMTTTSGRLAEDVQELVASLGGRVWIKKNVDRTYKYRGEQRGCQDTYTLSGFSTMGLNPFLLERKAVLWRHSPKTDAFARRVVSVDYVRDEEVQCIAVSAESHLYISHDFVPSHNTPRKMPGQTDFPPISLTRGMVKSRSSNSPGTDRDLGLLWQWYRQVFFVTQGGVPHGMTSSEHPEPDFKAEVIIKVFDHPVTNGNGLFSNGKMGPVRAAWKLYNCWPASLAFSDLDAGGNGVMVNNLTLMYEGFDLITNVLLASSPGSGFKV